MGDSLRLLALLQEAPCMITAVTLDGKSVLFQNERSQDYFSGVQATPDAPLELLSSMAYEDDDVASEQPVLVTAVLARLFSMQPWAYEVRLPSLI